MKKTMSILLAGVLSLSMFTVSAAAALKQSGSNQESPDQTATSKTGVETEEENVQKGDPNKKAILVVSFGTSYPETREATIGAIEEAIREAFDDYDVRRAFTSQMIIDKLAQRDRIDIDNVDEAMQRLVEDGVGTLICQPTHLMHGLEYDEMVESVNKYADYFETISFGAPLLSSSEDYAALVDAMITNVNIPDGAALCLMGHGTEHFADAAYAALDYRFKDMGYPHVFVGTVEGYPSLDSVIKNVKAYGAEKVILTPLMVVCGDHAINDMAGDEEDSWKMQFISEGFEVETLLKGLGEYGEIRDIYVAHVQEAIDETNEEIAEEGKA